MNANEYLLKFFAERARLVNGYGTRRAISTTRTGQLEVRLGAGDRYWATLIALLDDPIFGDFEGFLARHRRRQAKQNRTYQFNFVGVLGLGTISALGERIARDGLLQHGPPLAFSDIRYLLIALVGALIGLVCRSTLGDRLKKPSIWIHAAALGFFAVVGSTRALAAGLTFVPVLVLGIVAAVGGCSLRDVFSGRSPKVFERGHPYVLVAALRRWSFLSW